MQRQKWTEELRTTAEGAMMTELTPARAKTINKQDLLINLQTLISQRSGVAVEYITLNSNFCDDLGLDWLDVIELTVLIEQQFPGLAVADDGQVTSLNDLIRNIQVAASAATEESACCSREEHGQRSNQAGVDDFLPAVRAQPQSDQNRPADRAGAGLASEHHAVEH
jgi:acyl carrier protein